MSIKLLCKEEAENSLIFSLTQTGNSIVLNAHGKDRNGDEVDCSVLEIKLDGDRAYIERFTHVDTEAFVTDTHSDKCIHVKDES